MKKDTSHIRNILIISLTYVVFLVAAFFLWRHGSETTILSAEIIVGVLIFSVVLFLLISLIRKIRYLKAGISKVDEMTGEEFEQFLKVRFAKLGYKVTLTQKSSDFGADLILQKNGFTTVVQAKRYKANIGVKAVQEAVAARGFYDADSAMVVTSSKFTASAVKLAVANDIELWDREEMIKNFNF